MASNSFFLMGGICYVAATSWDLKGAPDPTSEEDAFSSLLYNILWTSGPVVYLVNSVIDTLWAWRVKEREKLRRQRKEAQRKENKGQGDDHKKTKRSNFNKPQRIWRRVRKHVGHRRELSAAVTFGIAAAFATAAMVVTFFDRPFSGVAEVRLDTLSVHCYMLSAVFALCGRDYGKPTRKSSNNDTFFATCSRKLKQWGNLWFNARLLENLGDVFFGVGSIVDVILCDFHFDDDVPWLPVFSSILWFLDACFYLRSDYCVLYSTLSRNMKEFDTGEEKINHFLDESSNEDDSSTMSNDSLWTTVSMTSSIPLFV